VQATFGEISMAIEKIFSVSSNYPLLTKRGCLPENPSSAKRCKFSFGNCKESKYLATRAADMLELLPFEKKEQPVT